MKVLFAVNDENISTSIVKKYQKQGPQNKMKLLKNGKF